MSSNLLDQATRTVETSASPVAFERTGGGAWREWDRFLTVDGKKAYHLGNICGTCAFLFERLEGANATVDVADLSNKLAAGVSSLPNDLVDALSLLVPVGDYRVALLRLRPRLVSLGGGDDYFAVEQVENQGGVDSFWGLPHHPKVPYYRPDQRSIVEVGDEGGKAFDFIVPMFPEAWLKAERVEFYAKALEAGAESTAVSISVLDIKEPAEEGAAHWCMAHYLLDGHHKIAAAARTGRPITLIAFVAVDHGISRIDDVEAVISTY
ncbi:hypothetical protein [Caulobacter soli]|uniref:hypothetical protein n=1 Tax=Caulobacter soli TaxID=2708539 RepID=UPI0013E9B192|nr:hypothetical protein [Caulobacter soli]